MVEIVGDGYKIIGYNDAFPKKSEVQDEWRTI